MMRALAGLALGLLARIWLLTVRFRVVLDPRVELHAARPWVLAFWHGHLLLLLPHQRRRRTTALVSWSSDGDLLSWAMRWFRVHAERGSGSSGGRVGLRAVISSLHRGWDAAFAVDGPRGPRGVPRPGALAAARDSGAVVIPYGAACSRVLVLSSWDGFSVPMPFSRVVVALGAPMDPSAKPLTTAELAMRLDETVQRARRGLDPSLSQHQRADDPLLHSTANGKSLPN